MDAAGRRSRNGKENNNSIIPSRTKNCHRQSRIPLSAIKIYNHNHTVTNVLPHKTSTGFSRGRSSNTDGPSASSTLLTHSTWDQSVIPEAVTKRIDSYQHNSQAYVETDLWQTFKTIRNDLTLKPYKIHKSLHFFENGKLEEVCYDCRFGEKIIFNGIPSLNRKTLKKQICQPSNYLGVVNLDPNVASVHPKLLYNVDLMNDIIRNIIIKQHKNIIHHSFYSINNKIQKLRIEMINWLVKLHQYLNADAVVLFMSIRMFDKLLASNLMCEVNYQLNIMVTFWISLKYINSDNCITVQNLLKLCNNRYGLNTFLKKEKHILKHLSFDIIYDDPLIFVHYFIYVMQIEQCSVISFSSSYFLELLALSNKCNCFSLSLQAASAVYLALKLFNYNDSCWFKLKKYYGYHQPHEMVELRRIIIQFIMFVQWDNYPYQASYNKYASERYHKVSIKISTILEEMSL